MAINRGVHAYLSPPLVIGLPFKPIQFDEQYSQCPLLVEILSASFPGVKTSRDEDLVSIERDSLEAKMVISHRNKAGLLRMGQKLVA